MNIPRFAGLLLAEHDYRVFGNSHHIEVLDRLLRTARALGQRHKGHSQESQDNKCKHFVHHIFFLLLINMLEDPPGTLSTGSHTKCCRWSNRCASRETGSRVRIPEQFSNQTQSAQREGTRTDCSNRYRGGVKKDTCGVEQT